MAIKTNVIDLGMDQYLKEIKKIKKKPKTEIGVMKDDDSRSGKIGNVDLMKIHEFGIGVPQRSVIRAGTDKNIDGAFSRAVKEYGKVIKGSGTINSMVGRVGVFMEGKFKKMFSKAYLKPNAKTTIRLKGSDTPLIDSGQLRQSIKSKTDV